MEFQIYFWNFFLKKVMSVNTQMQNQLYLLIQNCPVV